MSLSVVFVIHECDWNDVCREHEIDKILGSHFRMLLCSMKLKYNYIYLCVLIMNISYLLLI
jgi:hypothetical protein